MCPVALHTQEAQLPTINWALGGTPGTPSTKVQRKSMWQWGADIQGSERKNSAKLYVHSRGNQHLCDITDGVQGACLPATAQVDEGACQGNTEDALGWAVGVFL